MRILSNMKIAIIDAQAPGLGFMADYAQMTADLNYRLPQLNLKFDFGNDYTKTTIDHLTGYDLLAVMCNEQAGDDQDAIDLVARVKPLHEEGLLVFLGVTKKRGWSEDLRKKFDPTTKEGFEGITDWVPVGHNRYAMLTQTINDYLGDK